MDAIRTAGYDDIKVEPRLTTASQRRADIFYVDRSSHKHIHYYTDDVVCHPLCESHIGEVLDPLSTLRKVEGVKAASYAHVLDGARSAAAVSAGLRVILYTTCSFTSLGALGTGTVKCLNAAAGYLKRRTVAVARTAPRDSGFFPVCTSFHVPLFSITFSIIKFPLHVKKILKKIKINK